MSYIFGDLKTELQTEVGDANLSTTIAGNALNNAEQAIFNTFDLTLNTTTTTATVSAGARTLSSSLPTNFQKIQSLYVTSPSNYSNDLTDYFLPPKEFRTRYPNPSIIGSGPLTYWTYLTQIEFANNADVSHTLTIDYTNSVTLMSNSTDVPTIPENFKELLLLGAKIRIFEQKEDFDYAQQFKNRYSDLLESFVTRYSTNQVDYQAVVAGPRGIAVRLS